MGWDFGVFVDSLSESLKERIDNNQGQRVSGRFTYLPYYDEPSNGRYLIHTAGVVYTHDQDGIVRFRSRRRFMKGRLLSIAVPSPQVSTRRRTSSCDGKWTILRSERSAPGQCESEQRRLGLDWRAYAYCSIFNRENHNYERYGQHRAQFGRVTPFSNFFWVPGCCGPGAWELKARWSNLTLNELGAAKQRCDGGLQLVLERSHPRDVRLHSPGDEQCFAALRCDDIGHYWFAVFK